MQPPFRKRALFLSDGFTLMEMLIAVALIGIITALLTPKFVQMQEEALRQTARQQVKTFEKGLAEWYNAQPTSVDASVAWDTWDAADGLTDGYAQADYVLTAISPYLTLKNKAFCTGDDCITDEMAKIPGTDYITDATLSPGPATTLKCAHIRFYWTPKATNAQGTNNRFSYAPKVVLFLPNL